MVHYYFCAVVVSNLVLYMNRKETTVDLASTFDIHFLKYSTTRLWSCIKSVNNVFEKCSLLFHIAKIRYIKRTV